MEKKDTYGYMNIWIQVLKKKYIYFSMWLFFSNERGEEIDENGKR